MSVTKLEVTSIDAAIFSFRLINFHLDPRPWNDLFEIIKYSTDTLPSRRNTYTDPSKKAVDSAKLPADHLTITMLLYIIYLRIIGSWLINKKLSSKCMETFEFSHKNSCRAVCKINAPNVVKKIVKIYRNAFTTSMRIFCLFLFNSIHRFMGRVARLYSR